MYAPSVTTRHPAEAQMLSQAVAGDPAAVDRVLTHLGSANPWLQQIMRETIQDDGRPVTWRWLLDGLAHGWGAAGSPQQSLARERRDRIDEQIFQLFTGKELSPANGAVQQPVLDEALTAPDKRLRITAATVLGLRGDTRGFHLLLAAAREGEPACRLHAVEALGRLQDERAGGVLVEVMAGSDDPTLHHAAAHALAALQARALPALMEALHHPERHVRWHACRLLGDLGDARAAPALAEALGDEAYNIRWAAAETLGSLGQAAIPALLARLARYVAHEDTYQAAHYTLRRLAVGAWRPRLAPLLEALDGPAIAATVPGAAQRLLDTWDRPDDSAG